MEDKSELNIDGGIGLGGGMDSKSLENKIKHEEKKLKLYRTQLQHVNRMNKKHFGDDYVETQREKLTTLIRNGSEIIQHLRSLLTSMNSAQSTSTGESTVKEIVLDLNAKKKGKLNESWLAMLGGALRHLVHGLHLTDTKYKINGTEAQVKSFFNALQGEKKYLDAVLRHGLNDPNTFRSKSSLERAIKAFEKETGAKWPIE